MRPRLATALATLALLAAPEASAHDFWIEPIRFQTAAPGPIPSRQLTGHGDDQTAWDVPSDRVIALVAHGPGGTQDQRATLLQRPTAEFMPWRVTTPGTHVFSLVSSPADSTLPPDRFAAYLADEGLTPIAEHRTRTGTTSKPGREIFSRRAKALVQVGPWTPETARAATTPIGHTLEIVPVTSPYAPGTENSLTVCVFWQGKPLPGALVKLHDLDAGADARPVPATTNAEGEVTLPIRRDGRWLITTVWAQPLTDTTRADYDTVFASLTFGYR